MKIKIWTVLFFSMKNYVLTTCFKNEGRAGMYKQLSKE